MNLDERWRPHNNQPSASTTFLWGHSQDKHSGNTKKGRIIDSAGEEIWWKRQETQLEASRLRLSAGTCLSLYCYFGLFHKPFNHMVVRCLVDHVWVRC